MDQVILNGKNGWVLRGSSNGGRVWHRADGRTTLCGVKFQPKRLWTNGDGAEWPFCQRCLHTLKNEERRVALEIVSYFFAKGKSWADYEMDEFEQLRDRHLWLTQAIAAADPHYQPADYGRWIRERQERDAKEVTHG